MMKLCVILGFWSIALCLIAQALFSRFRRSLVWVAPIANFYLFNLEPKPAMNKQIKQKS